VNMPWLMAFATEKEKSKAADAKNFWHAGISESSKWKAKQTKSVLASRPFDSAQDRLHQHARRVRSPAVRA
jgi:hypothetical protein